MELWAEWLDVVNNLRGAFSRERAFYWMVTVLIGFTIKFDYSGVTSIARGVGLLPCYYTCLLHFFESNSVNLDKLRYCWIQLVFKIFPTAVKVNGRYVVVGDGIKIGKEGKKMPGVKSLYQDSQSNSKAEYIMGHSLQVASLLVGGLSSFFAVPLSGQIHEGYRFNCKDKRTLLDKMFELLIDLGISQPFYFVADRYYCSGRLIKQLIAQGIHLITRMKGRAVGYYPPEQPKVKKRGRPKKYGEKVKLVDLFEDKNKFVEAPMPRDEKTQIKYRALKLLWRPFGDLVQFVLVIHPVKGNAIFLSTDLESDPLSVVLLYSLRYKIEVTFKHTIHQIGTFMYHFWLKCMRPTKRGDGNWLLHFAQPSFKIKVERKLHAYHLFIMLGFIAQGLMQYLSVCQPKLVWPNFGTWLRTIRSDIPPSEKVVSLALSQTYGQFIADDESGGNFKKFIRKRIDFSQVKGCSSGEKLAA